MRKLWEKIGCFLTGWNYEILKSCTEASRKQLKKYTSAMLILIILWAFIGYSFSDRYIHTNIYGSIGVSIIFITIIVQIERQIILTVKQNRPLEIFRIIIAFIMALLGSTILDQIIFKDDIGKKMIEIVDKQVDIQSPKRQKQIKRAIISIEKQIDSLQIKNQELNNDINERPIISNSFNYTTKIKVPQPDGSVKTVSQINTEVKSLDNPNISERDRINKILDKLDKTKTDYTNKNINIEEVIRKEIQSKQGFLEELSVMLNILHESPVALLFYSILFFFLMSLELLVVFSKMGDQKSDYDHVIIHQLQQKIKTLDQLVK